MELEVFVQTRNNLGLERILVPWVFQKYCHFTIEAVMKARPSRSKFFVISVIISILLGFTDKSVDGRREKSTTEEPVEFHNENIVVGPCPEGTRRDSNGQCREAL